MQRWEYCCLAGVQVIPMKGWNTSHPRLFRYTARGCELVDDFKHREKGLSEEDVVAMTIARLGEEGWQLTGGGGLMAPPGYGVLWFMRPLPGEQPTS